MKKQTLNIRQSPRLTSWAVTFFLISTVYGQSELQWTNSMVVASETGYITAPRIALLPDGKPLVVWGVSGSPSQIRASSYENGEFLTPVSTVEAPFMPSLYGFAGFDMANSGKDIYIVFEQLGTGIFLTHSSDGGLTFGPTEIVSSFPSGGYLLLASVAINSAGNPLVSYIQSTEKVTWQFQQSQDGGMSFLPPVEVSMNAPGDAICECCTSDMLVSGDTIWMVFRNNNNNLRDNWMARSSDGGATFDVAQDMDNTDWIINACPISGPLMAAMGDSIITVWKSGWNGTSRVYASTIHRSTMQLGWQFDFPSSDTTLITQNQPGVAAKGDTIGVVFQRNGTDIVFSFSATGTSGFQGNSYQFSIPGHTFQFPTVVFQDGIFHLVYVDETLRQVIYRQGKVVPTVPVQEPRPLFNEISIFPNPVSEGFVWVNTGAKECKSWAILNVLGKIYSMQDAVGSLVKIDLTGIPSGVYFLKIQTSDREFVQKLIKN